MGTKEIEYDWCKICDTIDVLDIFEECDNCAHMETRCAICKGEICIEGRRSGSDICIDCFQDNGDEN